MISIQYTFFDFLVFKSHFTFNHIAYLVAGLFFVISSIFLYSFGYKKSALIFLIIGGFTFRLLMTIIDPFIHLWDEQFHALVAYNMISDPFNPMLYKNPLLPYGCRNWTSNYIWLHKQPFLTCPLQDLYISII